MYSPKNRVIVKEIEQENKTASGIIISPNSTDVDNLAKLGELVVDAFVNIDGNTVKIPKGQRLFYSKFSGVRFNKDGEKYTSLAFSDIVATVDD
jgi:chaperonin GroES